MATIEDYDVVLDVSSLQQFVEAGWPIYVRKSNDPKVSKIIDSNLDFNGKIVSVLGLYDKGKSYLINKLFHVSLGSGKRIHTRGVSMKFCSATPLSENPENDQKEVLVLDTAGVHSPGKIQDVQSLIDKKSTEMLLQDLVFYLTDFIIVVVNDLTWPDQEYLLALNNKLKTSEKSTNYFGVVVVHNFKETDTEEEFLALWKEQVTSNYYGVGAVTNFGIPVRDEGTLNRVGPKDSEIFYFTSKNPKNDKEEMRHVAIAKEGSPAGKKYNRLTFELIRRWLDEKSANKHHVMNEIETFCKSSLKTLFGQDVTVNLPPLKTETPAPAGEAAPPPPPARSFFSRSGSNVAPETKVVIASLLSAEEKDLSLKQKVGFAVSGLGVYVKSTLDADFTAHYDIVDYNDGRRVVRVELPGMKRGEDFKVAPDYATNKLVIEGTKPKLEKAEIKEGEPEPKIDTYGRKFGKFRCVIDLVEERPRTGQTILYKKDGELRFEDGVLYIPLVATQPKQEEW